MAQYHLSAKVRTRGARGAGSTPLHAQYILRQGRYAARQFELAYNESGNMPEWAQSDPLQYWRALDDHERANGRACRSLILALPDELTKEQNRRLASDFVREITSEDRLPYTLAIHDDGKGNPHCHVMINERGNDGIARTQETWFKRANAAEQELGGAPKIQKLNGKRWLLSIRELWAHRQNQALAHNGWSQRVDHRSYRSRGFDIVPGIHRGVKGRRFGGQWSEDRRDRDRKNGDLFLRDPEQAVRACAQEQPAFTAAEFDRFLRRVMDGDRVAGVFIRAKESGALIELRHRDEGQTLYSSAEQVTLEARVQQRALKLSKRHGHGVSASNVLGPSKSRTMGFAQELAYRYVTQESGDVAVVQGYAGAGKSYMLGAAREAWNAQGLEVLGAALSGKAASSLQAESGIPSRTLASWEYGWAHGKNLLRQKQVLVIDEAGMVGTDQLDRFLAAAESAGAKVVLVGDTAQLQAISSGAGMQLVAESVGQSVMSEIRRQEVEWQQNASVDMGNGLVRDGLGAYARAGMLVGHVGESDAIAQMVKTWATTEGPKSEKLMGAFLRRQVRELNDAARAFEKSQGRLRGGIVVDVDVGSFGVKDLQEREFSVGDRVVFLKNDRRLSVQNGSMGEVVRIGNCSATIAVDGALGREVEVDFGKYNRIEHGYAVTIHKTQGATVDHMLVLASRVMGSQASYVAMSRHRKSVQMHWSVEQFGTENLALVCERLGENRGKRNVANYHDLDHGSQSGWRSLLRRFVSEPVDGAKESLARLESLWRMPDGDLSVLRQARLKEANQPLRTAPSVVPSPTAWAAMDSRLRAAHESLAAFDAQVREFRKCGREVPAGILNAREGAHAHRESLLQAREIQGRGELEVSVRIATERREVARINRQTEVSRQWVSEIDAVRETRNLGALEARFAQALQSLGAVPDRDVERALGELRVEISAARKRLGLASGGELRAVSQNGDRRLRVAELERSRAELARAALAWEETKRGAKFGELRAAREGTGPKGKVAVALEEARRAHEAAVRDLNLSDRKQKQPGPKIGGPGGMKM